MVCLIKFCTKHTHGVSYPAGIWNISSPLPVGVVQQKSLAEQHSCPCTPINIILIINGTNIQINILFTDFVMMLVLCVDSREGARGVLSSSKSTSNGALLPLCGVSSYSNKSMDFLESIRSLGTLLTNT